MPVADLLVDAVAGHKVISFMDGNAGYNQIFMAIEDISKTAFRCPGHIGLFEWIVMTFGLKNAGATYQRAMNYIFHELIGKIVEIYIDDVVIKSLNHDSHLEDVEENFGMHPKAWFEDESKQMCFWSISRRILGIPSTRRGD
jgi:hypothetical protein